MLALRSLFGMYLARRRCLNRMLSHVACAAASLRRGRRQVRQTTIFREVGRPSTAVLPPLTTGYGGWTSWLPTMSFARRISVRLMTLASFLPAHG